MSLANTFWIFFICNSAITCSPTRPFIISLFIVFNIMRRIQEVKCRMPSVDVLYWDSEISSGIEEYKGIQAAIAFSGGQGHAYAYYFVIVTFRGFSRSAIVLLYNSDFCKGRLLNRPNYKRRYVHV